MDVAVPFVYCSDGAWHPVQCLRTITCKSDKNFWKVMLQMVTLLFIIYKYTAFGEGATYTSQFEVH